MHVYLTANALADAAKAAHAFAGRRDAARPHIHLCLISALSGALRLCCQSDDGWGQVSAAADVQLSGEACVDPADVARVAATLGTETISLRLAGKSLVLTARRGEFRFATYAPADWPPVPVIPAGVAFAPVPSALAARIAHAVATDDARYGLNGARAERVGTALRLTGTDGYRLALADAADADLGLPPRSLVSRAALAHIGKADGIVEVGAITGHLLVRNGATVGGFRLIDGEFPDYRAVLPGGQVKHRIVLDTAVLSSALTRASVSARGYDKRPVALLVRSGHLALQLRNVDLGEYTEDLDADCDGDDVEIAFALRYLRDALTHRSARVALEFDHALGPCRVVDVEPPEGTMPGFDVVMPMRWDDVAIDRPTHDWRAA